MNEHNIDIEYVLLDSINYVDPGAKQKVIISGSHGGIYPAYKAAISGARAVILNDAGIGLNNAGIACLDYCDRIGMAAAVISHDTARIGDARDMYQNGVLSGVNDFAKRAGCDIGMQCPAAVWALSDAPVPLGKAPSYKETRFLINEEFPQIVCIDSASLVLQQDVGTIIITGSHGGLIGGNKEKAFNIEALVAVFNDAGVGKEKAGIGRLKPLEEKDMAAITVAAGSAMIGNSRSTLNLGVISYVNKPAGRLGAQPGLKLKDFVLSLHARMVRV